MEAGSSNGNLGRHLAIALSHAPPREKLKALAGAAGRINEAQDHLDVIFPGKTKTKTILDLASASSSKGVRLEALALVVSVLQGRQTAWAMASDRTKNRNFESWSTGLATYLEGAHRTCRRGLAWEQEGAVRVKWLELARTLIKVTPYRALERGLELERDLLDALLAAKESLALLGIAQYMAKSNSGDHSLARSLDALRKLPRLSLEDQNTAWDLLTVPAALERLDETFVDLGTESARSRADTGHGPRTCNALTFLQKKVESGSSMPDSVLRLVDGPLDHLPAAQVLALIAVLPLPHGALYVEECLASRMEDERASAVRCFGCRLVPTAENIGRLVTFCKDSSAMVRAKATWSLANLGETVRLAEYEEDILEMARDASLARIGGIRALGQLGGPRAVEQLVSISESDEARPKVLWNVCAALVQVLGRGRPPHLSHSHELLARIISTARRLTTSRGNFKVRIQALDLLLACTSPDSLASLARASLDDLDLESASIPFTEQLHLQQLRDKWIALVE